MAAEPQRIYHYQNSIMNSAKWDPFVPHADDIIITTSYKAGTAGTCLCPCGTTGTTCNPRPSTPSITRLIGMGLSCPTRDNR